jgi:hypothetical protein
MKECRIRQMGMNVRGSGMGKMDSVGKLNVQFFLHCIPFVTLIMKEE